MAGKSHWWLGNNSYSALSNTFLPQWRQSSKRKVLQVVHRAAASAQAQQVVTAPSSSVPSASASIACAQRQTPVEMSLVQNQLVHCSSTYADTTVEVRGEQKEQISAQGLLLLLHPILLWHNTTGGHQRMDYVKDKSQMLKSKYNRKNTFLCEHKWFQTLA